MLISVIIPVYNSEKFLNRCVDSVLKQSYKELDIILIDDGSSDKSGEMCDQYAQMDKRVRVIHQKNREFQQQEIVVLMWLLEIIVHL